MSAHNRDLVDHVLIMHRRTAVICILDGITSRCANLLIILDIVREYGCGAASEQLRQDFIWLRDMRLVELEELGGIWRISLLERGVEVVHGHARCEGLLSSPENQLYRRRIIV